MNIKKHSIFFIGAITGLIFMSFKGFSQKQAIKQNHFFIKNVNVITMDSVGTIIKNATIIIKGNHIISINGKIPKDATMIDGKGKWLIPGLIDMHMHLATDAYFGQKIPTQHPDFIISTQDIMTPLIANGVTSVLDLNATMETFGQKKK